MLTGEIRNRIDRFRHTFRAGGLSNPLERRSFPEGNDP
jgi:hypothetical protein